MHLEGDLIPSNLDLEFRENPLMSACGYNLRKVTERAVGCTPAVCKEMVKNCSAKRITKTPREPKQETEKETAR